MKESLSLPYTRDLLNQTEERLRTTSKELSELRRGIDAAMIVSVSNLKGEIIHTNEMMSKMTGYSINEIVGKSHRMFNSGFHPRSFFKDLWETVTCGRIWRGEIKNKRKDGAFFWVDTTIVPFFDCDGRVLRFMSFRKDITDRKTEEERSDKERAAREYAGRLAAVGETASNIAHEIRNPLGAILMSAELTRMEPGASQDAVEGMKKVEKWATQIKKIIEGVSLLSRDASSDPFESVAVVKSIRDVVDIVKARVAKENIQILVDPIPEDLRIKGRSVQIFQVLMNLVNNAADAIQGQSEKWVRIGVQRSDGFVKILVKDSGDGIPAELTDKIMKPYFTTKAVGKGTGLGLSISKEIINAHGGRLYLDTSAKNTSFVIELPLRV